ncbi:hypothetical protein U9M48_007914 [Paspalum notatum var. saurae]|uniref:F-box domain-containing protein n=1 Tax=Paspalum notatum var. saurae TaxID=547442 RepID=A0AAQ3SNI6_PASNO
MSGGGEITRRRRSLSSPEAPAPLDNDDILGQILIRLSPQPSSLPRASLVCKRWHRVVSDPGFLRSFRAHHRKPPVLGFFSHSKALNVHRDIEFTSVLDPPDRIPGARASSRRLSTGAKSSAAATDASSSSTGTGSGAVSSSGTP